MLDKGPCKCAGLFLCLSVGNSADVNAIKMNKEQLAEQLNGNEYGSEHTKEQALLAKKNGLVIVYGQSDDLIEFEGAVYDEVGMYEGGEITINSGVAPEFTEDGDITDSLNLIRADWAPDETLSWRLTANFPFAKFVVNEDGEPYCEGFVFDIKDLNRV